MWGRLARLNTCRAPLSTFAMAPKRRAATAAAKAAAEEPAPPPAAKRPKKATRRNAAADGAAATDGAARGQQTAAQERQDGERAFYLMKSEPDVFSIDDLAAKPHQTEPWDGVRNHQAKKVLQSMRVGDQAFFYHSNAKPPGIVGVVEVVREAYPDHTQFDPESDYYDAAAKPGSPKWFMVDVQLVRKLSRLIPLEELKAAAAAGGALAGMALVKFGRLSVQHVTAAEWEAVLAMEASGGSQEDS